MKDLVIIGAGATGLTATLYSSLYGLDVRCVGNKFGGKLLTAPGIIDYPGFLKTSGKEFIANLTEQVKKTGAIVDEKQVIALTKTNNTDTPWKVTLQDGVEYETKTVLLATGNANKQGDQRTLKLIAGFSIEVVNGLIKVNDRFQTKESGIYAAGDCIVYPFSLEQLLTSVATGAFAVAAIYESLKGERPPILWGEAKLPRFG